VAMTVKKWVIWQAPLRQIPTGDKFLDIPSGTIVEVTGRQQPVEMSGQPRIWSEILYNDNRLWVYDGYLEDLVEKYPNFEVIIEHPTPDPYDAAQYLILDGHTKYNMCGELCVAFIGGDSIETFLNKWLAISPSYYKWALQGDSDKSTGIDALESMLSVYGYSFPLLRFDEGLTDPVMGFRLSPGRINRLLRSYSLIAGVNIDGVTGKLRGQGVGHWVVVDKITPNGVNCGWVELYNPFPNKRQDYSYDEFINSVGSNRSGIWVPRHTGS
jgi:hypothetical protein